VHKCFTKKQEEEAANVQSSQAAQGSTSTSTSKPENKPVGSANTMTIDNLDGDGFWLVKEVDTHMHINYTMPDPEPSNMESDVNDKASCAKLVGAKDEQALDWFGSDDQLVSERGDWDTKEEANMATLKEEVVPHSEAQPVPHHALHAPVIIHTLVSPGAPNEGVDDLQIVSLHRECIAKRQNWMLLELLWVLWHVIWVWLLKPLWGAALLLTAFSKHTFEVLYQTLPVKGKVQCIQASLLKGEGMRMLSTSSEQTAVPATPSNFIAPKSLATPSEATPAVAQPAWTVCFLKPSHV
jgi:hypothetical protein